MSQPNHTESGRKSYTNSGLLGRNKRFVEGSELPPYSGYLTVTCPGCRAEHEFWMNAKIRQGRDGSKFFGIWIKPKDSAPKPAPKQPSSKPQQKPETDDVEDDLF